MLKNLDVLATIAVKELAVSRKFYEEVLGLNLVENKEPMVVAYKSGDTTLLVYQSEFAGTNKATCVTWIVEDGFKSIVDDLKSKGVVFEHYDLPGTTRDGDIHISSNMKNAWFKDPDGNIICLVTAPGATEEV